MTPVRIFQGDTTAELVRRFELRGGYAPMLDDVIVPVAVVADLTEQDVAPAAAGNAQVGGAAANFGILELFNPAGSGVDLQLYRWDVTTNGTTSLDVRSITAAQRLAFGAVPGRWLDLSIGTRPVGEVDNDVIPVPAGIQLYQPRIIGSVFVQFVANVTIPPNTGIQIQDTTANFSLFGNFYWREVPR